MIAQLVSWFLAFAAVFVFGLMFGIELGSKRGWHRGRAALIREQKRNGVIGLAPGERFYSYTWGPFDQDANA